MARYPKLKNYEGFEINPEKETIRFACCDCGLVHDMGVAIVGNRAIGGQKVQLTYRRCNRGTAQLRRHNFGNLQQKSVGRWRMRRENA